MLRGTGLELKRRPARVRRFAGASIVEVLLVYVLTAVLGRWAFAAWSGWSLAYASGILLIAVPVTILLVTRRDVAAYGFTLRSWREQVDLGLVAYLLALIPWAIGMGLIMLLGSSYTALPGACLLVAAYLFETWLLLVILRRRERQARAHTRSRLAGRGNLVIIVVLLVLPLLLAAMRGTLDANLGSTVVWQFVFSGFGEEIRYRGYYQSRINQEFGRPWSIGGIRFGPGLIIAALLFGLSHVLNPFNPFAGQYDLAWWWGLWTCFSGLFLGLLREKAGGLIAPGIAHGLPDAVGEGLAVVFGWRV